MQHELLYEVREKYKEYKKAFHFSWYKVTRTNGITRSSNAFTQYYIELQRRILEASDECIAPSLI